MSNVETRQVERDSLFLMADVRIDGGEQSHRVKVRNLSNGGMMAEGDARVARGALVVVTLRNIGDVEGSVAWTQDNRFGIAFVDEIDPSVVRAPASTASNAADFEIPRFTRNHQPVPPSQAELGRFRKI